MSLPYITGMSFTNWDKEVIAWIPKEPGNRAPDRRRPIALLEVMRKVTLGVKKNKVSAIWEKYSLLDKGNFAFQPGKFIHGPILIKRALLEDAKWFKKQLITLDVDYKAAFDKVPCFIKEMSLRKHDQTRQQHVSTAYGLANGIHPRCGAFGQGAEESPMGFVSLMCWKCGYIYNDVEKAHPYKYTAGPSSYRSEEAGGVGDRAHRALELTKTLFCDDSSYTTCTVAGASYVLHRIGIFVAAAGGWHGAQRQKKHFLSR